MKTHYKNIYIRLPYFIVVLFTLGCNDKDCHKEIGIINNSNKSIYIFEYTFYPDTTMMTYNNPFPGNPHYKTLPHTENYIQSRDCFESFMTHPQADTSMIFIFDANVIETVPWDTIRAKYLFLKRYDLSLMDLENMNWTITYP